MPLSELTTESYFKTATLVRDWRDYHFCGRMFHPPLLAVIVSFFASVKSGISIQLVAIATFCFATRNTYVLRVFCAVQLECHTGDFA